jgi:hypothetical protein
LSARRAVAEIGAKEHADGTSYALLSKMDMSLLDSPFEATCCFAWLARTMCRGAPGYSFVIPFLARP